MQENSFTTKQFYKCKFSDLAPNYSRNYDSNKPITRNANCFAQKGYLKPNLLQQSYMGLTGNFQQIKNFQDFRGVQADNSIKITSFYSEVKKTFSTVKPQQKNGIESITQINTENIKKFESNTVDNIFPPNKTEIGNQYNDPTIKTSNNTENISFKSVVQKNSNINISNPAIISKNQSHFFKPLNYSLVNQIPIANHPDKNYSSSNLLVNKNDFNFTHNDNSYNLDKNLQNFSSFPSDSKNNEYAKKNQTENLYEFPSCHCNSPRPYDESIDGPFYSQLGTANSVNNVKIMMLERLKLRDDELRVERVRFTGKDGKNSQGCPIAKWIIRRSSKMERALVLVRLVEHHYCINSVIVVAVCLWDGVSPTHTDPLYDYLKEVLPKQAEVAERKCGTNDKRTCACQGDDHSGGASFSFGCSWSMYYNGCKFARSVNAKKFSLKSKDAEEEKVLAHYLQTIATLVAPIFKMVAPVAYQNQTKYETEALDCRLGYKEGRPWSGVTSVMDFCTHAHRDTNNMHHGCTTVLTLTKHRGAEEPEDEQLHVLPSYILEDSNVEKAGVEVLMSFPSVMKIRSTPFVCKNKLRAIKAKERKKLKDSFSNGNCNKDDTSINFGKIGRGGGRKRGKGAKSLETNGLHRASFVNTFHSQPFHMSPHNTLSSLHSQQFNHSSSDYLTDEYLMSENHRNLKSFVSTSFTPETQKTSNDQYATELNTLNKTNQNSKLCCNSRIPLNYMYNNDTCSNLIDRQAYNNANNYNNIGPKIDSFNQHYSLQSFKETNLPYQKTEQFSPDDKRLPFHNTTSLKSTPLSFKTSPILPSFSFFKSHINNTDDFYKNNSLNYSQNSYHQKFHNSNLSQGSYCSFKPSEYNYSRITNSAAHGWIKNEPSNISNTFDHHTNDSSIHYSGQPTSYQQNSGTYSLSNKNMHSSFKDLKTSAFINNKNSMNGLKFGQETSDRKSDVYGEFGVIVSDSLYNRTNSQPFISYNMTSTSNRINEVVSMQSNNIPHLFTSSEASQTKEVYTTNTEVFKDSSIGGVAIALPHGSLLFEVAKRELHATTALKRPNRRHPTRISVVLYQHKSLNKKWHGRKEYEKKCLEREEKKKFQQEVQRDINTNFGF